MVAQVPDDKFDVPPAITVNLPTDGQPSGPLPVQNEGLTEEHLPPMPAPPGPPSFTPTDVQSVLTDPRAREVLGTINKMQHDHAQRSGEMPVVVGQPDMVTYAKAQARFLWEKMAFHNNATRPGLTDPEYIDLLNRYNFELERLVTAQIVLLRQLGAV